MKPIARPIPFSGPMVDAVIGERKFQTRRVIPYFDGKTYATDPANARWQFFGDDAGPREWRNKWFAYDAKSGASALPIYGLRCPYGVAGDQLWVREAFRLPGYMNDLSPSEAIDKYKLKLMHVVEYLVDGNGTNPTGRYRPARFMPRALSRMLLQVVGVVVERLQDISEDDARQEGIYLHSHHGLYSADHTKGTGGRTAVEGYRVLWDELNAARGFEWDRNPWVFVVIFKRCPR